MSWNVFNKTAVKSGKDLKPKTQGNTVEPRNFGKLIDYMNGRRKRMIESIKHSWKCVNIGGRG